MWCGTPRANDSVIDEPADSVKTGVDTVPPDKTKQNVQKPAEATTEKPTIKEQINEQAKEKEESAAPSAGLTIIDKSEEKTVTETGDNLTPIKSKD